MTTGYSSSDEKSFAEDRNEALRAILLGRFPGALRTRERLLQSVCSAAVYGLVLLVAVGFTTPAAAEDTSFLQPAPRAAVYAYQYHEEPYPLDSGPHLLIDWRYVCPGHSPRYTYEGKDVPRDRPAGYSAEINPRIHVEPRRAPFGVRIELVKAEKLGPVIKSEGAWEYFLSYANLIRHDGKYKLFYNTATFKDGYPWMVCYAESSDGIHYTKPELGLVEFDGGCILPGAGLVEISEDRVVLPYAGFAVPHKFPRLSHLGDIALAVWPKQRLAALVADEEGYFVTIPLSRQGRTLWLNFETTRGGSVAVEVDGVAGRDFAACDTLWGNHLQKQITWNGEADMGVEPGGSFFLRFRLRAAKLYSFEIKCPGPTRPDAGGCRNVAHQRRCPDKEILPMKCFPMTITTSLTLAIGPSITPGSVSADDQPEVCHIGSRLEPFVDDCREIYGDEIDRAVSWKGAANVGSLAGKTVRLRFAIRDADLYSLRFTPAKQ